MSNESQEQMDNHNSKWSKHLPDELIELIVKRLTLVDSIRFAAVCPSWRRVSSQWFQRVTRLPWILKLVQLLDSEETVNYSLYSPSEAAAYDLKFPRESAGCEDIRCSGSAHGWLIMSEIWEEPIRSLRCINYLLNPMTGDRIKLPQLVIHFIPHRSTASSDPRSPDCIIVTQKDFQVFNFCRPGSQNWSWTTVMPQIIRIDTMTFQNDGKLYVIGRNNPDPPKWGDYYLLVFVPHLDMDEITWDKERVIELVPREPWTGVESIKEEYPDYWLTGPALTLSSEGKLLLGWVRRYVHEPDPPFCPHHVVKIDDDGWPGWENSLGVHLIKKGIWAAYDASEDELVLLFMYGSDRFISLRKFKSATTPTIDERFIGRHCGKQLNTCHWDTTEDGLLDDIKDAESLFTPNIAE